MKINKQTKRKCIRNAFRDIKVPHHVPSQSAVPDVLGDKDLHRAGRIASGPTEDVGVPRMELEARQDSLRHPSWPSKSVLGN